MNEPLPASIMLVLSFLHPELGLLVWRVNVYSAHPQTQEVYAGIWWESPKGSEEGHRRLLRPGLWTALSELHLYHSHLPLTCK